MARDATLIVIGWRFGPYGQHLHYWQRRAYSEVVMSACGLAAFVHQLSSWGVQSRCYACDTLMKLRPGTARQDAVSIDVKGEK
jgi:hypothetical protein